MSARLITTNLVFANFIALPSHLSSTESKLLNVTFQLLQASRLQASYHLIHINLARHHQNSLKFLQSKSGASERRPFQNSSSFHTRYQTHKCFMFTHCQLYMFVFHLISSYSIREGHLNRHFIFEPIYLS
jgi:hypothetical protein